jgi:hypothetical protein
VWKDALHIRRASFSALDLFRQILDPRAVGRTLLGVARVEPLNFAPRVPVKASRKG